MLFSVAPSPLGVLRVVESVWSGDEFRRGRLRFPFSVERVVSASAEGGDELALARVFFPVLVGIDLGVRWALDRAVMVAVARFLSFSKTSFSFVACLAARHKSHGAFFFLLAHLV